MLVKKIDPEWQPAEYGNIAVGQIVEVTDPKKLIIDGKVEAIDDQGMVVSSYELYGVISKDDKKDFEEWLAIRKQTQLEDKLKKDQADLKEELSKVVEMKPEPEEKKDKVVKEVKTAKNAKKA